MLPRCPIAKQKTLRERRTYNDEYKQKVLELISVGDKSVSQICRDLDLTTSAVHRWIKADKKNSDAAHGKYSSKLSKQSAKQPPAGEQRAQQQPVLMPPGPASECQFIGIEKNNIVTKLNPETCN